MQSYSWHDWLLPSVSELKIDDRAVLLKLKPQIAPPSRISSCQLKLKTCLLRASVPRFTLVKCHTPPSEILRNDRMSSKFLKQSSCQCLSRKNLRCVSRRQAQTQTIRQKTDRTIQHKLPPIFRHQLLVRTYTDLLPDLSNFWKLQSAFGIWQSTLNLYIIVDVFHWRMIVNRVRNHWTTWRDHHSQEFCPSGNILFIKVRNQWKQQTRKQKNGLLNE